MRVDRQSGLMEGAKYIRSPNHDARPHGADISLIVLHNISLPPGEFGGQGVNQLFTNHLDKNEHPFYEEIHELRVSSHVFIRRDGEVIQYVPFHLRAWHAGVSCFEGQAVCNDYSIGIELEGTDDKPFREEQYAALDQVLTSLLATYPSLSPEKITGHEQIAPMRKTDPGPCFNWHRVSDAMQTELPAIAVLNTTDE
ncbi:MAG: N-acetylmuramoyl-L-alanine amidase (EC AmpD [uncultured Thiotrichaceae bacterium]|uniref:1,6-anhydro-N-acetylmuramyl-L-alanine amidase AmpD n=1 Tax=uncultured Thiotrichaceae bacterium TaxID=298394 RepID=A0A6S6TLE9_9GAMM|nr:MAG: N-acetylmuramoyl-L-alanine amidase (EC AmpD [uncultured Thiotrichaceae bacterium]